jgi:hypothetical protein
MNVRKIKKLPSSPSWQAWSGLPTEGRRGVLKDFGILKQIDLIF